MSASRSTFTRCCRPVSSFPQKCDASSMRWMPMAGAAAERRIRDPPKSKSLTSKVKSLTSEVIDWRAQISDSRSADQSGVTGGEHDDRRQQDRPELYRFVE